MNIFPVSRPLKDLDISASILTDIQIVDDVKQTVDDELSSDSQNNPVKGSGIWEKLRTLSSEIYAKACEHDISCELNGIVSGGEGAVKSDDAWVFLGQLSTDILNSISHEGESITVIDTVVSNSSQAVKSSGIYNALTALSTLVKDSINVPTYVFEDSVIKDNDNAVKSRGIYNALKSLSNEVLLCANSAVHPIDLNIDSKVTETGTNVVSGCGIYEALSTLSDNVLTEAYKNDLSLQINLTETGEKPVASKTIWTNLSGLSTVILSTAQYNLEQLSNHLSADINTLSANLSNDIGNLYTKLSSTLSSIENEPVASLTYNSDIDDVISSVLEIRTILSSLYCLVKA